jgi:hypothetical protein
MGFEILKQALDEGQALGPITQAEVTFSDEKLADDVAMKIVIQDANLGERYLNSKTLPNEWNLADDLFRAYVPPKSWPNSNIARSNIPVPLVMETIGALLPQCHMAYFSDPQPFLLDAKGKTSPQAARVTAKVLGWAIDCSGFEEEIRKALKGALLYGTTVLKRGWKNAKYTKKNFKRATNGNDIEIHEEEHEISEPTIEWVDLRNLIVDPSLRCHDITKSRYRIHQIFTDANGLDDLRADPTYKNVPTREQLAMILAEMSEKTKDTLQASKQNSWREQQAEREDVAGSVDPLKQPLELLEWETDTQIVTVLQRCIVIRNERNDEGCHYHSCAFEDVLNSFYGFSVAKLIEGEQRLQAGALNKGVDSLALALNPIWQRKKGLGARSQNVVVGPGKVVNDDGELVPLEIKNVMPDALEAIQASEARAARRVGANYGNDMPNQAMRTAEGVQAFTSGVQVKIQYFIEMFARQVFIPILESFIVMCKENLTPDEVNAILTEEEGQEFKGDVLEIYNGKYNVSVLSSTKLAGRRAMQAMIPMFLQMFGQPAIVNLLGVQGKKIDFVEFFNQVADVSGWPLGEIITDMTPEDQQRQMMSNPAVVNAQAKQQQQTQQHQNDLENIQAKGDASAGVAAVKHLFQASADQHKQEAETAAMAKPLATQPKQ